MSGLSAGYGLLDVLLIVATGVYLGMLRSGASIPRMSISPAVLTLGGSVINAALVLLRWLFAGRVSYSLASYSYGPRFGMIIEVLAGIVQAACAPSLFRRSGEELPWKDPHTSDT
ncbi:MAG TPA: hypothetical protein VII84_02655 [Acidimicrobiales bacterium]